MNRSRPILLSLLVIAILAGLGVFYWQRNLPPTPPPPTPPKPSPLAIWPWLMSVKVTPHFGVTQ